MPASPTTIPAEKENLHPRNLHRGGYDFTALIKALPELNEFVKTNEYHNLSVDFSNPDAVKALNKALLKQFYSIDHWDIPAGYLCPPIPGRADYIHYMADLLAGSNNGEIPKGDKVKVLDVGVGANCVYPLIGNSVYDWNFTGTDVDLVAVSSAKNIVLFNPALKGKIDFRLQPQRADIFNGVVNADDVFDLTICNPPFHTSLKEAQAGNKRKWDNLDRKPAQANALNFGGKSNELWYKGGELAFVNNMIKQSEQFSKQCFWFTTLISKKDSLDGVYRMLHNVNAVEVKTINMSQGQKISRVVAWTFLTETEQFKWKNRHWA
ncbi:23S rRNA (adenine(1618)-N(6))-methyltransferase RlmF [Mucilaginibacter terrae]|uniref:23S rRNA (adenine(1618)-N(6))-methyltransferase RlmF n=1 Tax=Mucilaginibacter terrae TaxID=1955052 RepID=UPI003628AB6A